jgi:hypothetical protein
LIPSRIQGGTISGIGIMKEGTPLDTLDPTQLLESVQGYVDILVEQCKSMELHVEAVSVANAAARKALRWLPTTASGELPVNAQFMFCFVCSIH